MKKKMIVMWRKNNIQVIQGSYEWACRLVGENNILFVYL